MTVDLLKPEDIAYLRRVAWRGRDEGYLSKLRQIYGLPSDLGEITIGGFPQNRTYVVTVYGPSGVFSLRFVSQEGRNNVGVHSLFFSRSWIPPSLTLDVNVQPVIEATEEFVCRVVPPRGGVQ